MAALFNVLSYGENHYKAHCNGNEASSIHAEQDAVRKLPRPHKKLRHLKKLDIMVVRVNRNGSLGNSKPCVHCLYTLSQLLPEKGYCISRVYYSTHEGEIVDTKLNTLLREDSPHVTKFYQDRPNKIVKYMTKANT
jgi:hypothetical protein